MERASRVVQEEEEESEVGRQGGRLEEDAVMDEDRAVC